jgi:hypothetical protein
MKTEPYREREEEGMSGREGGRTEELTNDEMKVIKHSR